MDALCTVQGLMMFCETSSGMSSVGLGFMGSLQDMPIRSLNPKCNSVKVRRLHPAH